MNISNLNSKSLSLELKKVRRYEEETIHHGE